MAGTSKQMQQKAYDLGYEYEGKWGDCSQAAIRSLMEVYDEVDKDVFKAMAGFHGGGGCECDASCGASSTWVAQPEQLNNRAKRTIRFIDFTISGVLGCPKCRPKARLNQAGTSFVHRRTLP